jgi:histidinol-phosphate aminotransferase
MTYERENIQKITGYTPGEQPDSLTVIKLNTNENPYPPSEAVMRTLRNMKAEVLRRYPPPNAQEFCGVAAQMHGVKPENIIATNGGDELLRLAMTTFVDPLQSIGYAEPSYSLYPVLAEINNSPVVRIPLNENWSLPQDFAEQLNKEDVKLAFIVNPHAPSGYLTDVATLARMAETFKGVLLIDEAYVDFVDPDLHYNSMQLLERYDNVLILRSLSKGYSLAGLRYGYGIGNKSIIEPMLTKTKDSYNVDAISQHLALAALNDRETAAKTWRAVRTERQRLINHLKEIGFVCTDSQANFLLATVPDNLRGGAKFIYESLKRNDIFVRYFDAGRLRGSLRISIGKPDENDVLLKALRKLV